MPRITPLLALSAILVPSIAIASSVEFEIDGSASSATTIFDFQLPLAGTLIGDYDAKANPGGTQTRPGLFGGSGNNPIDCEIGLTIASDSEPTSASGTVVLDLEGLESNLLVVEGLDLDLLSGETAGVGGELGFLYETFNTINPFSIYPGGITIPIPIANGEILRSEISLLEPTTIPAMQKKGDVAFDAVLPVLWTVEFDPGTGPQVQEIPVVIPFVGSVMGESGSRSIRFGGSAAASGSEPLDFPVGPIPLPLPTIPPSDTPANLVFTGLVTSVDFATDLSLDVFGAEVDSPVFGDINFDGIVNAADLGLLIASWGPCKGCPADLNGDGIVDAADLGLMIAAWTI